MLAPHAQYVVKIEVFADPQLPAVSGEELATTDYRAQIQALLEQMAHASPAELQDQVYRRFAFRLCPSCQRRYVENPLGSE